MAIPAILQQLARNNIQQLIQPAKQMMDMVKASQNPQLMLNQLAMRYPQLKQALDTIQKYGGDPFVALQKEAEARGINPQEIMDMLR